MKLSVAIQMDHVSTIDIDGDSTFVLGLEAQRRGRVEWYVTYAVRVARVERAYSFSTEQGRATCPH